ncbi:MAG: hypothetical protein IPJ85_05270 [Flavobacteriales bacterium]|nr:hypothetical protein [Flavobacteriales bacterium]
MKMLNAFLRCELPYHKRYDRINDICFAIGLLTSTSLVVYVLSCRP